MQHKIVADIISGIVSDVVADKIPGQYSGTEKQAPRDLSFRKLHVKNVLPYFFSSLPIISPQAIISPELPEGWVVKSSGLA